MQPSTLPWRAAQTSVLLPGVPTTCAASPPARNRAWRSAAGSRKFALEWWRVHGDCQQAKTGGGRCQVPPRHSFAIAILTETVLLRVCVAECTAFQAEREAIVRCGELQVYVVGAHPSAAHSQSARKGSNQAGSSGAKLSASCTRTAAPTHSRGCSSNARAASTNSPALPSARSSTDSRRSSSDQSWGPSPALGLGAASAAACAQRVATT